MLLVRKNVASNLYVNWRFRTPTGTLSYFLYLRGGLRDQIDDGHPGLLHFHFLVSANTSPSLGRYDRFPVTMNIPVGTYKYVVYASNNTANTLNSNRAIGIVDSGLLRVYENHEINQYETPDVTTTFHVEQTIGE
jgi:hypothetical protein